MLQIKGVLNAGLHKEKVRSVPGDVILVTFSGQLHNFVTVRRLFKITADQVADDWFVFKTNIVKMW